MRTSILLVSFFLALACAMPARAGDLGAPLPPERLDALRGGYALGDGLTVSFGLERLVSINGELVVSQRVEIPDLARMTAEQARQLADLAGGRTIRVGDTMTVAPGTGTLVIQNALDGQQIQASTSLHTTVNTLSLLQNLNFNQSLADALRVGGTP